MKLTRPALQAIGAAEARLAASRRKTRDGLHRARAAFRASLTRPSTLVLAAGAAGVAGLWLARRPRRRRAVHSKAGMGAVVAAYAAPFVQSLLARSGKEALSFLVDTVRETLHKRADRHAAQASAESSPDPFPTGVPH